MKNKGMLLEMLLNKTICFYKANQVALFHKKGIDFKFQSLAKTQNQVLTSKAWVTHKSTVDYYGVYKGNFVAFEAKSTVSNKMLLKNIRKHQKDYLQQVAFFGGIAFYVFGFVTRNEFYFVTPQALEGRNHKSYVDFQQAARMFHQIDLNYPGILDFLPLLENIVNKKK